MFLIIFKRTFLNVKVFLDLAIKYHKTVFLDRLSLFNVFYNSNTVVAENLFIYQLHADDEQLCTLAV